jgi:hypothetical protein
MAKASNKSNKSCREQPRHELPAELPLDSPYWLPASEAHRLLAERLSDRNLAAKDLALAMADRRVAVMQRRLVAAPGSDRKLVPAEFWGKHQVYYSTSDRALRVWGVHGHAWFLWLPNLAEVWPDVFASMPPSPALTADPIVDRESKRGRKPFDDWELFKAKFYLLLYEDDVPAYGDINAHAYARRLVEWGGRNLGEEATPDSNTVRNKIAEWKPLWPRLKVANK